MNLLIKKLHLQSRLNFFSSICKKFFLLSVLLITGQQVYCINISSVYFSACMRENGVIISVDENKIQLLTLEGDIRNIPRFDIIYIAYYPIGNIRIPKNVAAKDSMVITIKTLYEGEVFDLVKGWMIDHSEDQFSFLSTTGTPTVVDTEDIWDIEITPLSQSINSEPSLSSPYEFVHPYPFMECKTGTEGIGAANELKPRIYPQYLLSEPLLIKNELDRLKKGYDRLQKYDENKRFYPVPKLFSNDTSLGMWVNLGSRYGSSKNRNNSFIPFIRSELTEGPFGFQRVLVTGVAPMNFGIHEEPQFQASYQMKSSYVHFSIMVDISRFNIGQEKYKWSPDEMESYDDRENEIHSISGGFDYGEWSVDVSIMNTVYYAIKHDSLFHKDDIEMSKNGIFYHNRFFRIEFFQGFGMDKKPEPVPLDGAKNKFEEAAIEAYNESLLSIQNFNTKLNFYRLNLELYNFKFFSPTYSLIQKSLQFKRENAPGESQGEFRYSSKSLTNALFLDYSLDAELKLRGYFSLESSTRKYSESGSLETSSKAYPKAGLSVAFLF
mgnify:FL=1